MIVTKDSSVFINRSIDSRATDQLINYENSRLEIKYPEFRYLMNEFHDGILLFEISGRKIWNKVSEDTAGLKQFYEEHKNEYLTKKEIEGKIYTLKTPGEERKLLSAVKKYYGRSDIDNRLMSRFNKHNDTDSYYCEWSLACRR